MERKGGVEAAGEAEFGEEDDGGGGQTKACCRHGPPVACQVTSIEGGWKSSPVAMEGGARKDPFWVQ